MKDHKKNFNTILFMAILAAELVLGGVLFCRFLPSHRMADAIAEGQRYLAVSDHDNAAVAFRKALMIAPQNARGRQAVTDHLSGILDAADQALSGGEYDRSAHLSGLVLGFGGILGPDDPLILRAGECRGQSMDRKEIESLLEHAGRAFQDRAYADAAACYDLAAKKGAAGSGLEPNRTLSRVYDEVIRRAANEYHEALLELMDDPGSGAVFRTAAPDGRTFITDDILIGQAGGSRVILYGGLTAACGDGTATALISGTKTHSVYTGEWKGYVPQGNGTLRIWRKGGDIRDAVTLSGTFRNGLCDGTVQYRTGNMPEIPIGFHGGTAENTFLAEKNPDYVAGVCGFGGSDALLQLGNIPGLTDWHMIPGTGDPSYEQAAGILDTVDWDLKKAFDWSAGLPYYGHGKADMPESPDPGTRWFASYGFTNGKGNCFVMAATFFEFARLCGYEPRQMCGMVPSRKGGLTIHSWVEIDEDGQTYVYDPDFQYNKGVNGFRLQYGQPGIWKYQSYSQMSE